MSRTKTDIRARFWKLVAVVGDSECWVYTGKLARDNYGRFRDYTNDVCVQWQAHRLAYTLAVGEIPDGLLVLHKCDNRPCCNPKHLFVGTQLDNVLDCLSKGRGNRRARTSTLLSENRVEELKEARTSGLSWTQLAEKFGVGRTTCRNAVEREERKNQGALAHLVERPE
jgi:hypothetical protein